MTYGQSSRALVDDASFAPLAKAQSTPPARPWQALNAATRLALIEQALRATNDDFPLAL